MWWISHETINYKFKNLSRHHLALSIQKAAAILPYPVVHLARRKKEKSNLYPLNQKITNSPPSSQAKT